MQIRCLTWNKYPWSQARFKFLQKMQKIEDFGTCLNRLVLSNQPFYGVLSNQPLYLQHILIAAYVSGEREGLILENPCMMGETLNGTRGLDVEAEKKLIDETLKQLKAHNYDEDYIKSSMKHLGIQRSLHIIY